MALGSCVLQALPCRGAHLPGLQLLREVHLLLDGIQELAVEGHHVHLALGQLHLHRVLPAGTEIGAWHLLLFKLGVKHI